MFPNKFFRNILESSNFFLNISGSYPEHCELLSNIFSLDTLKCLQTCSGTFWMFRDILISSKGHSEMFPFIFLMNIFKSKKKSKHFRQLSRTLWVVLKHLGNILWLVLKYIQFNNLKCFTKYLGNFLNVLEHFTKFQRTFRNVFKCLLNVLELFESFKNV